MKSDEVKKCLQHLKPRKAVSKDKIPPALINPGAEPLSGWLTIAMNNGFRYKIFPRNASTAFDEPLDKMTEANILSQSLDL